MNETNNELEIKAFDLNIGEILEHWDVAHALKEIIANAIDEETLNNNRIEKFKIYKEGNDWIIRDYGRGLQDQHLIQDENKNKLKHLNTIGKFGIGLKDALAVFNRYNVEVEIISKQYHFKTKMQNKRNFESMNTLHVMCDPNNVDRNFIGTEFIFKDLDDDIMTKAKDDFLIFNKPTKLNQNKYGEVFEKQNKNADIYINGLKINTERNFLFSFNITNVTLSLKKEWNRERTNVGRNAYASQIQNIIKNCDSKSKIIQEYGNNLKDSNSEWWGEMQAWQPILHHIMKTIESTSYFVTASQKTSSPDVINAMESDGYDVIVIPEKQLNNYCDKNPTAPTLEYYSNKQSNAMEYKIIEYNDLSKNEKDVFNHTQAILNFFTKIEPSCKVTIDQIKIVTGKLGLNINREISIVVKDGNILILRNQLENLSKYSAGLFWGIIVYFYPNLRPGTIEFEKHLFNLIGKLFTSLSKTMNQNKGIIN